MEFIQQLKNDPSLPTLWAESCLLLRVRKIQGKISMRSFMAAHRYKCSTTAQSPTTTFDALRRICENGLPLTLNTIIATPKPGIDDLVKAYTY